MSKTYNHTQIEKKWQKEWEKTQPNKASDTSTKKNFYALIEFPYPSGEGLHVGHIRSNTAMDIIARKRRAEGFNVLYPVGWDAFGLPTENYAIKTGIQPSVVTKKNTDTFRRQLKSIGFSFDWSREVNTTDPAYYKWTQWIFLQFLKEGLAYKKKMAINWCPKDKIGLANEEVIDGKCERCGTEVEQREKEQWMLAITKYADRLDKDLDDVDYLDRIKTQQRNWIGRSEGVNFHCTIKDLGIKVEMYNSVPQSYHAETFTVIAPEHPLVLELVKGTPHEKKVLEFVESIKKRKAENKFDIENEMEGIFTGRYVEKFADTGRDLPIWIASYVVADYGTGMVNCSAHDVRDFAFAKKYNLPLRVVTVPMDPEKATQVENLEYAYAKDPDGIMLEPTQFKGRKWGEVRKDVIEHIVSKGLGSRKVNYKLRDWIFSRQRYWGEPIPVIHCPSCGIVPVPEKDLPVTLPKVKNYLPTDNGESPLAAISSWVNVKCPTCKGKATRETDTMPNWAGSSWYFLRYIDPKNKKAFADMKKIEKWMPVDWYNGGMEHTTLHLLYSRFWHKFLFDQGLVSTNEPYQKRTSHGLILAQGGEKMSKSKGNVVNPDDVVKLYGADTLRVYEMFMGPFDQPIAWSTDNMVGSRRFLERVWRLFDKVDIKETTPNKDLDVIVNKTIKKVSGDIETMAFNTAISSLMILLNAFEKVETVSKKHYKTLLQLVAPFAPHITEELWQLLKNKKSIHQETWPTFDEALLVASTVTITVQVNGKMRDTLEVDVDSDEETVKNKAMSLENVKKWLDKNDVKRVIYVKNRLINIVI